MWYHVDLYQPYDLYIDISENLICWDLVKIEDFDA